MFLPIALLLLAAEPAPAAHRHEIVVEPGKTREAEEALASGADGLHVIFRPGEYSLEPDPYREEECGNCEQESTEVRTTCGLLVRGRDILIEGSGAPETVVLHTGAGYGVLFEDCEACSLRSVTVTGGVRDSSADATDAAVVAKRSRVMVEGCVLSDNLGDSTAVRRTVVGIAGIVGRRDSRLDIRKNKILRNSWDGIALYRGARAVIEDNRVDGVDLARGDETSGGRGVGIGITWDARADIRRNFVTRYWKGIGVFVDADATVEENVVQDVAAWGICLWDAGKGRPSARIQRNVVCDTGAFGIGITRAAAGGEPVSCGENVVRRSGQNPKYDDPNYYGPQRPIAVTAASPGFALGTNFFFENRRGAYVAGEKDSAPAEFFAKATPMAEALRKHPALGDARVLAELIAGPPRDAVSDSLPR